MRSDNLLHDLTLTCQFHDKSNVTTAHATLLQLTNSTAITICYPTCRRMLGGFKTAALNHSATLPRDAEQDYAEDGTIATGFWRPLP